ncbi:MAG: metallophosphoesterase family protein [Deltaproteobacteria bacterium]|nr:metallophosphoesterase family protein [Deltaproteobacteria bacterium]
MKIGVISDTHLNKFSPLLQRIADTYFKDVEMVFHAGDIVDLAVLDVFLPKKVEAVAGNMDPATVINVLPAKKVITVKGFKIGLIHGWGNARDLETRLRKEFTDIDCLVYGHSHTPANHVSAGVLFFNPGSPTDSHFAPRSTVGVLEVTDAITGTIIDVEGWEQ